MARLFFGGLAGIVLLAVFFYFGGPKYLKAFGAKTEETGQRLEKYEKRIKDSTEKAGETVKEARKTVNETFEKAKEKIKEYMPE